MKAPKVIFDAGYHRNGEVMIRVAVAEDELHIYHTICEFLHRYGKEHEQEIRITHFVNGLAISEPYRPDFDIILMDIDMPLMDGMEAARRIRKKDPSVIIIFITNLSQYAIQGYSVQAFDYILKPLSYFAFSQFFGRAAARLQSNNRQQHLTINLKDGVRKVAVQDIYYIEIKDHTLFYYTSDDVLQATGKMKELEIQLSPYHFIRCSNSYLVNLAFVDRIRDNDAIVHGETLPISRSRKKEFSSALIEYIRTNLQ